MIRVPIGGLKAVDPESLEPKTVVRGPLRDNYILQSDGNDTIMRYKPQPKLWKDDEDLIDEDESGPYGEPLAVPMALSQSTESFSQPMMMMRSMDSPIMETSHSTDGYDVTMVLTNYKRPEQIKAVMDSVPVGTKIFLLDNAPDGFEAFPEDQERADWYLRSKGVNDLFTRWYMASQAWTTYFCVHDDDVVLKDWSPYLEFVRNNEGFSGIRGNRYLDGDTVYNPSKGSQEYDYYDMIVGRVTFGKVKDLQGVRMFGRDEHGNIAEDIAVGSQVKGKFFVPEVKDGFINLPDKHASSSNYHHNKIRNRVARKEIKGEDVSVDYGVVTCYSPSYKEWAYRLKDSLGLTNPVVPFTMVEAEEGIQSRVKKLSVDQWSPYQTTLFIDCDAVVRGDLLRLLDGFKWNQELKVAMVQEQITFDTLGAMVNRPSIYGRISTEYASLLQELPAGTPYFNSGVMLFEKNQQVHEFFQRWRDRWNLRGGNTLDQLPLSELVIEGYSPQMLPEEWNYQMASKRDLSTMNKSANIYHFLGGTLKSKDIQYANWLRLMMQK